MTPVPKILLVDDNPDNLRALEIVLRDMNVELIKVTNGNDALKATLHHDFALALLDVQMPEMDGYELANILRTGEKTENLPFIFISAVYTDQPNITKGYTKGAFNFFAKPFNPDTLVRSVELFLDKHNRSHDLLLINEELKKKNAELEAINKELVLAKDEAIKSRKIKDEFLANMSHELRTPLNPVLILSKVLCENRSEHLSESEIKCADIIHQSANHLMNLIDDILDLSKLEAKKSELSITKVSLTALLRNISNMFSEIALHKKIRFIIEHEPHLTEKVFYSDMRKLEQILRNLISNALKFSQVGGEVKLKVSRNIDDDHKTALSGSNPEIISFAVIDNGIGIPKEKLEIIFDAFKQADPSTSRKYGGTGLGLSISNELAKLLDGKIKVESIENKGSIFTLYVPLKFEL